MTGRRPTRATALLLVALLGLGAGAASCAAGQSAGVSSSGTTGTFYTTTRPPGTLPAYDDCTPDRLADVAKEARVDGSLLDVVCVERWGVATIVSPTGAPDRVGLFTVPEGRWELIASGAVDRYTTENLPKGFSSTAFSAWSLKRSARTEPTTTAAPEPETTTSTVDEGGTGAAGTVPGGGAPTVNDRERSMCHYDEKKKIVCVLPTTTTIATTTTTTTPGQPGDPAATTTTSTVPRSQFCTYNYVDPRCVADPSFPG